MTPSAAGYETRRIAAIVAAVQAYLFEVEKGDQDHAGGISAWRRAISPLTYSSFTARQRSWKGRD